MGGIKKKRQRRSHRAHKKYKHKNVPQKEIVNNDNETGKPASDENEAGKLACDETNINVGKSDSSLKRSLDEDSDGEDSPIPRKKKKKKPAAADSEPGKKSNKKSIRQVKREKYLQRQAAAEAAAKESLKTQCLNYLTLWKHSRDQWKFMKAKQVWLYKNKFFPNLIPEESWSLLLEYFDSTQGNIRNMLLDDAKKVIKQMDDYKEKEKEITVEESESHEGEKTAIIKPDEISYKRARDILQHLEEKE